MEATVLLPIGTRKYELLGCHYHDEGLILGGKVIGRGRALGANMRKEDGEYFLNHADDLRIFRPFSLHLAFPEWQDEDDRHGKLLYLDLVQWSPKGNHVSRLEEAWIDLYQYRWAKCFRLVRRLK